MDIINYDFIAAALVAFLLNPLLVTTTMVVLQSLCSYRYYAGNTMILRRYKLTSTNTGASQSINQ